MLVADWRRIGNFGIDAQFIMTFDLLRLEYPNLIEIAPGMRPSCPCFRSTVTGCAMG